MTDETKMNLESMDIAEEKRQKMKQMFPEVFSEDKIDFKALQSVLGEIVDAEKEHFGLTWPGKADCMKVIQAPSVATLIPCRNESINFDETENLFIEGDNLQVLKLLQKSYFGKVRLIYIDPPYNTGNEFIYPDNYAEDLETYLSYTQQIDENYRKFSTNSEVVGRFHTNWLNMIYPRLYLAKNLLSNDGIIFISIDDNEESKLREICDQIFGGENFISKIVWQKRTSPDARYNLGAAHDYILAYGKSIDDAMAGLNKLPLTEERKAQYKNPDNDERGPWASVDLTGQTGHATASQYYVIKTPSGKEYAPPEGRCWALAEGTFQKLHAENRIWFGADGSSRPRLKKYLSESEGINSWTWWTNAEVGHSQEGTRELKELFGLGDVFNNPKPTRLIERVVQLATKPNDIVLDFFAGSCTSAQAVLNMNAKDGGSRKFIVVQLPEICPKESSAAKAGLRSVAEIGKERIRLSIQKLVKENEKLNLTSSSEVLGFKVFKLAGSNFKIWNGNADQFDVSGEQLDLHVRHINKTASYEDILYEILLKSGFHLSAKIEKISVDNKHYFSIEDGLLIICLEKQVTIELVDEIAKLSPIQVIFLDEAFLGNDQLKVNVARSFTAQSSNSENDIIFRTI